MLYALLTRYLFDPVGIAIVLLVAALVAEHNGKRKLGRGLVVATALFLAALAFLPIDAMLARPLENAFSRPAPPAHVDGIVVLSGGTHALLFAQRGAVSDDGSILRMVAGAELARRYPNARLIFSGTSGGNAPARQREREAILGTFAILGIAPQRVIYEDASRDTWENLRFSMALARPKPGETWLLVTSAMHMPRSMAIARRLGWTMLPWPSDYETTRDWRRRPLAYASEGLMTVDRALHEWIGLIAYGLEGKTR
ncbi:MAG TPA: YdcF family protein [Rhizomicrobium sp.]|nr:YdcF family protein [Rhizomicrobium sp.]